MRNVFLVILAIFIFCNPDLSDASENVYVLNTLGQNLSVVTPATGTVDADAAALGLYTNDIKIKDNMIYVVNSGINEVQVLDLISLQTLKRFDTGNGTNPYLMDFINDSTIAVTLLFTNEIAFINLSSGEITRMQTGVGPTGLKYVNGLLYVCNTNYVEFGVYATGIIDVIDPQTHTHMDTIQVGTNPNLIEVNSDGEIFVLSTGNYSDIPSKIFKFDQITSEITDSLSLPGNPTVSNMYIDQQDRLFLSVSTLSEFGNIMVYDLENSVFLNDDSNPLLGGPGIAVDRNGQVYAPDFGSDSLFIYDANLNRSAAYLVGDGPLALALHPDLQTSIEIHHSFDSNILKEFRLLSNYPNPFNGNTTIRYELDKSTFVDLSVYTVTGQKIATIVNGYKRAGKYSLQWIGGQTEFDLSSGSYIILLSTGLGTETHKMTYLK